MSEHSCLKCKWGILQCSSDTDYTLHGEIFTCLKKKRRFSWHEDDRDSDVEWKFCLSFAIQCILFKDGYCIIKGTDDSDGDVMNSLPEDMREYYSEYMKVEENKEYESWM